VKPLFAKSDPFVRQRPDAGARMARACVLMLAIALVASGFLTTMAPVSVVAAVTVAASGGHCVDHVAPAPADVVHDRHATHAGTCCDTICACACTHAIVGMPLLALPSAAPAVRAATPDHRMFRAAPAAPPLRPPIA
jgi:hypothetical protein